MTYNFNERTTEKIGNTEYKVYQTSKYKDAKQRVIKMLESGKYEGLTEGHFWILMNKGSNNQMNYNGLIITHDGMKIINDSQPDDKKVKPQCFSQPTESRYDNSIYMYYVDESTIEYGEVSKENLNGKYPFAMLFKRTYDRVVKDKAKLYGVYSEEEADEFKSKYSVDEDTGEAIEEAPKNTAVNEPKEAKQALASDKQIGLMEKLYNDDEIAKIKAMYNIKELEEITKDVAHKYISNRIKNNENNK